MSERLALCETFGLVVLPDAGELAFLDCVNGAADRGEGCPVLARRRRRLDDLATTAPHGAHGVVAAPRCTAARMLQLGAARLVRRHAPPQRRLDLLVRFCRQCGHGRLRSHRELRDRCGIRRGRTGSACCRYRCSASPAWMASPASDPSVTTLLRQARRTATRRRALPPAALALSEGEC